MSQPISQSQKPVCIQCGGTEYVLESGYYFCIECQVQSQDIREEVFEDYVGGKFVGARSAVPSAKSQEETEVAGVDITSWEALNIILHGLVNELILLGAPKELSVVTLQLWSCYLKKLEAAFTSKHIQKRPRLGLTFRQRDAQLVYKTSEELLRNQKRPVSQRKRRASSRGSRSLSESSFSTKRSGNVLLHLKKKKLATAEYSKFLDASSTSQSSFQSELTLDSLTTQNPEKSEKSYRFHYSKSAKEKLLDLLDTATIVEGEDRAYLQSRCLNRNSQSLEHLTIKKLFAILRVALLSMDSDIHLGDLLRWTEEGYLSLLNAEKLIPPNITLGKDVKLIFITTLNSRETINMTVTKLTNFLGIKNLKSRLLPLIQRYLKELCLPSEIYTFIQSLIGLKPPRFLLTCTINYEARALAYIIFMLKYLFCLDGVTEKNVSTIAGLVNNDVNNVRRLFNFQAWMDFINCRKSVISYHHQGSRDLHHPTSRFGGANAFLSQWDKIPAKQTLPRKHIISRNLSEVLRRFMKEFCQDPSEPLPPSLLPQSTMLETILNTKSLPARTRSILEQDFTGDSLEYLFDIDLQKGISNKYGVPIISNPSAEFVIVKTLKWTKKSRVNPFLNRNKNVLVKIVEDKSKDHSSIESTNKKNAKRKEVVDSPFEWNVLSKTRKFLKGARLENTRDIEEGSWSGVGRGYWVYHSSTTSKNIQSATFDQLSETVLHPGFLWLLREAAQVGHVSPKELYRELIKVERVYLEPSKQNKENPHVNGW